MCIRDSSKALRVIDFALADYVWQHIWGIKDEMRLASVKNHILISTEEWDNIVNAVDKARTLYHQVNQQQSSASY